MPQYAAETWTFTKANERALGLLERRVFRVTVETVPDIGQWRRSV
jgi:hypothetical protein